MAQDGPKTAQDGPKMAQDGSKMGLDVPRWLIFLFLFLFFFLHGSQQASGPFQKLEIFKDELDTFEKVRSKR